MSQPSIEIRALELFAAGYKLSRMELSKALMLDPHTEITSRIRALRSKGFEVECKTESVTRRTSGGGAKKVTVYRYELPEEQRAKALLYLTERRAK